MRPRLEACYFGDDPKRTWARMAAVLEQSAAQHLAGWEIAVRHITPAPKTSAIGIASYAENSQKLAHWVSVVDASPDGLELVLVDADMMVLRSLDALWALPFFDFGYTVKQGPFPLNGGVIAVRVSPLTRAFMHAWLLENEGLLESREQTHLWRMRYGGVNQASLARLLKQPHDLVVRKLACLEWNCEDSSWAAFDPAVTRMVHVKGTLRRSILVEQTPAPELRALIACWRAYEQDTQRRKRVSA